MNKYEKLKQSPQRCWIDEPRINAPLHKYHGLVGIGYTQTNSLGNEITTLYFTSGPVRGIQIDPKYLCLANTEGDRLKSKEEPLNKEALEKEYLQLLLDRRDLAKNFRGQIAGRHPDNLQLNEIYAKVSGFSECYFDILIFTPLAVGRSWVDPERGNY